MTKLKYYVYIKNYIQYIIYQSVQELEVRGTSSDS